MSGDGVGVDGSKRDGATGGVAKTKSTEQMMREANENLLRALRTNTSTNEAGYATMQELSRQKETITNSVEHVGETRGELREARRIIRDIRLRVYKEWVIKGLVLTLLFVLDVYLFYRKFLGKV
ncbi:uncharacterized protein TEOVI_000725800 [Trypanosoma equiperdum]|uniref:Uncharacterized protein n=1 Tax=Trypanosoma equiperdum TaxID=5694 RepID=A0A1G4I9U8_TRYEQ|nr:hypothetical protein, conserved [Trypanosoma equiperdum]